MLLWSPFSLLVCPSRISFFLSWWLYLKSTINEQLRVLNDYAVLYHVEVMLNNQLVVSNICSCFIFIKTRHQAALDSKIKSLLGPNHHIHFQMSGACQFNIMPTHESPIRNCLSTNPVQCYAYISHAQPNTHLLELTHPPSVFRHLHICLWPIYSLNDLIQQTSEFFHNTPYPTLPVPRLWSMSWLSLMLVDNAWNFLLLCNTMAPSVSPSL